MKQITIGIPYYDDFDNCNLLLSSIESQELKDNIYEILIIDDGSEVPFEVPKLFTIPIRVIRFNNNKGVAKVREYLWREVKTQYLLSVDSDCLFDDVRILEKILLNVEDRTIVYPMILGRDGERIHPRFKREEIIPGMSTCYCIDVYYQKKVNIVFNYVLHFYFEDEMFFLDANKKNFKFKFLEQLIVRHPRPLSGTAKRPFGVGGWFHLYYSALYFRTFYKNEEIGDQVPKLKDIWDVFLSLDFLKKRTHQRMGKILALIKFILLFPYLYTDRKFINKR